MLSDAGSEKWKALSEAEKAKKKEEDDAKEAEESDKGQEHDADDADEALEEGEIRAWAEEPCRANAAEDGRKVKEIGDPRRPTIAEIEEHERSNHCPYHNWCGVCVRVTQWRNGD